MKHLSLVVLCVVFSGCSAAPPSSVRVTAPPSTPSATAAPTAAPEMPSATPMGAPPTPQRTPGPGEFRVLAAMHHATVLARDIGTRHAGSQADREAAEYAAGFLSGLGYQVSLERFPLPQGGESQNVVGAPPGFGFDRPYVMVGGHIDSLNGPGANDNASGVGAVLAIAEAVTEVPASLPLVVVAFGAEERQPTPDRDHHVGSRFHVENMSDQAKDNLVMLMNIDMVGRGGELLVCHFRERPKPEASDRLLRLAGELGIPARERATPDWSDNGPFLRAGLNAGWLWTGDDPAYHSVRDTHDRLQATPIERAGRLALAALRSYVS